MRYRRRVHIVSENDAISLGLDLPEHMRNPSPVLVMLSPIPRTNIPEHRPISRSLDHLIDNRVVKAIRWTK